jgi:hypothetical protein
MNIQENKKTPYKKTLKIIGLKAQIKTSNSQYINQEKQKTNKYRYKKNQNTGSYITT